MYKQLLGTKTKPTTSANQRKMISLREVAEGALRPHASCFGSAHLPLPPYFEIASGRLADSCGFVILLVVAWISLSEPNQKHEKKTGYEPFCTPFYSSTLFVLYPFK